MSRSHPTDPRTHRPLVVPLALVLSAACARHAPSPEPPLQVPRDADAEHGDDDGDGPEHGDEGTTDGAAPARGPLDDVLASLPPPPIPDGPFGSLPPPPEVVEPRRIEPRPSNNWATKVMQALSSVRVDEELSGDFRFEIEICKDGSFEVREAEGSTVSPEERASILEELDSVVLPPVPPDLQEHMKGECARIEYVFRVSRRKVR